MAAGKQNRPDPILSPMGTASFPWLNKADYTVWKNGQKDGEDPNKGKYKVDLVLSKDNPDHMAFFEMIKARFAAAVKSEYEKLVKQAKEKGGDVKKLYPNYFDKRGDFKEASYPWKDGHKVSADETDDTKVVIKFSMNAQYEKKDKTLVKISPQLWTAGCKPWPKDKIIGGGSEIIVSFVPNSFCMASVGAGLSLQMQAIQVIKLRTFGERTAEQSGFKPIEGDEPESNGSGFTDQSGGDDAPPHDDSDAPPPSDGQREF